MTYDELYEHITKYVADPHTTITEHDKRRACLILGSFMELGAILVLLVPILSPLLTILGIDLVHFGVVMIVNLMIGFITPPFGMSLFVVSEVADIGIEKVIKDTIPFMIPLIIVLLLITYFPSLVLAIPNFIMP